MAAVAAWRDHRGIPFHGHHHREQVLRQRARMRQRVGEHGGPGPLRWFGPHGRPRQDGPFRRAAEGRMVGGLASGFAAKRGIDPNLIRLVTVLACLASGIGAAVYIGAWLVIPAEGEDTSIGVRALSDARGLALAAAFLPLIVVIEVATTVVDAHWPGFLSWPLVVAAAGLVLIWRNGSDDERALLSRMARPLLNGGSSEQRSWRWLAARVVVGILLAGGAAAAIEIGHRSELLWPMVAIALILAAIVVVFGPWWLNLGRELVLERQARLRAEERADLASRVHDSVLQTLALIQHSADDPQRVAQLARAQERELGSWLFEGRPPGSFDEVTTVGAAIRQIQSEVEATHGTTVEVVVVGDGPLDEGIEALLAAGREAVVNAAKWSGAPVVSIYAEVEPTCVSMFVRDRGRGFDRDAVDAARKGVAESIEGRMARAGGKAAVRTAPGEGTEVELSIDRREHVRSRAASRS